MGLVAEWEVKENTYAAGTFGFDCWKFGVYAVDNVIVATPDHEAEIFDPDFGPEGLAVEPEAKLATTWAQVKSR